MDPNDNSLLRTFQCARSDLDRFVTSNWEPPVKLTTHEHDIVKCAGSALLQGRGGTGKTLCLISRLVVYWCAVYNLVYFVVCEREVDEMLRVMIHSGFTTISCTA
jgi:hypothetical protein